MCRKWDKIWKSEIFEIINIKSPFKYSVRCLKYDFFYKTNKYFKTLEYTIYRNNF